MYKIINKSRNVQWSDDIKKRLKTKKIQFWMYKYK